MKKAWVGLEKDLDAVSPVNLADRIKVPVFLAAGGKDTRAPQVHAERMDKALKRAGVPAETMSVADEGHGDFTAANTPGVRWPSCRRTWAVRRRNRGAVWAAGRCGRRARACSGFGLDLEIGLDAALDLHRHRLAATVQRLADLHPDPAFGDTVFLDVVALGAVEAHADATGQGGFIVEAIAGIDGQAVGRGVAHRGGSAGNARAHRIRGALP
jgi:hypothetical protein